MLTNIQAHCNLFIYTQSFLKVERSFVVRFRKEVEVSEADSTPVA